MLPPGTNLTKFLQKSTLKTHHTCVKWANVHDSTIRKSEKGIHSTSNQSDTKADIWARGHFDEQLLEKCCGLRESKAELLENMGPVTFDIKLQQHSRTRTPQQGWHKAMVGAMHRFNILKRGCNTVDGTMNSVLSFEQQNILKLKAEV